MKLVDFEEFVKLPIGTIYSNYEPAVCDGLFRKLENIVDKDDGKPIDFFYSELLAYCLNGEFPAVDMTPSRWGLFDYNAQFAVYEPDDIEMIKQNL